MYLTNEKIGPWVEVGEVGVDSGRLLLGDPAYVTPDLIDRLEGRQPGQLTHGVVLVASGFGDGLYPVEVRYVDDPLMSEHLGRPVWRVAEVRVRFIREEHEEEQEETA